MPMPGGEAYSSLTVVTHLARCEQLQVVKAVEWKKLRPRVLAYAEREMAQAESTPGALDRGAFALAEVERLDLRFSSKGSAS